MNRSPGGVDRAGLIADLREAFGWAEGSAGAVEIRHRLGDTGVDDRVRAAEEFLVAHLAEPEPLIEYLLRAAVTARRAVDRG